MSSVLQGRTITPDEAKGIAKLRESHFPETTESYGMLLDEACLVRYLRARDGSVDKAAAMLSATLDWRRDFGLPQASAGGSLPVLCLYPLACVVFFYGS